VSGHPITDDLERKHSAYYTGLRDVFLERSNARVRMYRPSDSAVRKRLLPGLKIASGGVEHLLRPLMPQG